MKRYFAALLLLMPMLFTGCDDIYDWKYPEDCPLDENFELIFRLVDQGGGDIFAGKIQTVDVVLFDTDNDFTMHRRVTRAELDGGNRVRLSVAPGTYRVVCWGNVPDNSALSAMTAEATFDNSYVETLPTATDGSPLYYGPAAEEKTRAVDYTAYTVTLPPGQAVEKEIHFVRAHRTVNIYFQGLANLASYGGGQLSVTMKNLPYRYDFYRNADAGRRDFTHTTATKQIIAGLSMLHTSFTAPIAAFSDDMAIRVGNASGGAEILDPLNLKTWVEQNVPDYLNEFDILYTVTKQGENVDVTVTLPNWNEIGVKPGDL